MIPAFSAHPSLATRHEAEIGAAMLANVRPKSKSQPMGRPPAPEPAEAESTTDRIIAALRSMRGQEGTLGDIMRHMPDVKPGAIRLSLSQAKAAGLLCMTGRSSFGIWRVREE